VWSLGITSSIDKWAQICPNPSHSGRRSRNPLCEPPVAKRNSPPEQFSAIARDLSVEAFLRRF